MKRYYLIKYTISGSKKQFVATDQQNGKRNKEFYMYACGFTDKDVSEFSVKEIDKTLYHSTNALISISKILK